MLGFCAKTLPGPSVLAAGAVKKEAPPQTGFGIAALMSALLHDAQVVMSSIASLHG